MAAEPASGPSPAAGPPSTPDSHPAQDARLSGLTRTEKALIGVVVVLTVLAGVAIALRFVPYSNHHGRYYLGWALVMAAIVLVALAASIYLIYVLEILKFKNWRARELRRTDPTTSEHEIDERVQREVETGEFERVG